MADPQDKARERLKKFAQSEGNYSANMLTRMKSDLEFAGGKQYSTNVDRAVRGEGRAELVFNLTRNYCNQITNQYRKKPYGIVVNPKSSKSVQQANYVQKIIRGWEQAANALDAYTNAVDRQVKAGAGYCVLSTDYSGGEGWDQVITITSISRPDMVLYDRTNKLARKAAIVEHIGVDVAKELLGRTDEDWEPALEECPLQGSKWVAPEGSVELCTYYELTRKKTKMYLDPDGNSIRASDMRRNANTKGWRSRDAYDTTVTVYKFVGHEALEPVELSMSHIPVYPCLGELVDIDGKQDYVGLVYFAKDPARLVNWAASLTAERIAISPKTTRFVDMKSIINYKDTWGQANKLNLPYLPFDSVGPNGQVYQAPVTDNPSVDISSSSTAQTIYQQTLSDILGMAAQGTQADGPSNETATAILTRAKSSELSNFQYSDNQAKMIKAIARGFVELSGIVNDTPRMLPLVGPQGKEVRELDYQALEVDPNDLDFDVEAGPMVSTQRQENLNGLLALGTMLGPEAALVFASNIVTNSEFEEAPAIAAKLDAYAKVKLNIPDPNATSTETDPEAVQALEMAQQTVTGLQEAISQQGLYIQQLQAEKADKALELQVAREKMAADYKKAIDLELLKQQGALTQQQLDIQANAANEYMKQQAETQRMIGQPPQITVVQGAKPTMGAILGQRNDLYS